MEKKNKRLKLIPATARLADSPIFSATAPVKGKKLNLPMLIKFGDKPNQINVGVSVSGKLVGLIDNFTGQEQMKGTKTIHLVHSSGEEFLIPLTGGIKSTFKIVCDEDGNVKKEYIGKTFWFTRRMDGVAKKYGGKPMFTVDVVVAD